MLNNELPFQAWLHTPLHKVFSVQVFRNRVPKLEINLNDNISALSTKVVMEYRTRNDKGRGSLSKLFLFSKTVLTTLHPSELI